MPYAINKPECIVRRSIPGFTDPQLQNVSIWVLPEGCDEVVIRRMRWTSDEFIFEAVLRHNDASGTKITGRFGKTPEEALASLEKAIMEGHNDNLES